MKHNKVLPMFLLGSLAIGLLGGCESSPRDKLIEQAKVDYTSGKLEKAMGEFLSAKRIEDFSSKESDLEKMYENATNSVYTSHIQKGQSELDALRFEDALKDYQAAYSISSHDSNVGGTIDSIKKLIEQQKIFDDYSNFVSVIFSDSNTLLREFNSNVSSVIVGNISTGAFKQKVKTIIPESDNIVAKMDDSISKIQGDLSSINQNLLSLVQYQHETFQMGMNDGVDFSDLSQRIIEVKKQQTDLVKSLQDYASSNGIAYKLSLTDSSSEK